MVSLEPKLRIKPSLLNSVVVIAVKQSSSCSYLAVAQCDLALASITRSEKAFH